MKFKSDVAKKQAITNSSGIEVTRVFNFMSDYSHILAIGGLISYRMLQWSYSAGQEDIDIRTTATTKAFPPPIAPDICTKDLGENQCPLCRKSIRNPTASISGFVFCYPCILRHVQDNEECPVTKLECRTSSLRRLYQETK